MLIEIHGERSCAIFIRKDKTVKALKATTVLLQVVDASISESIFNMLEGCIPEYVQFGHDRPPSGSTITGTHSFLFLLSCL